MLCYRCLHRKYHPPSMHPRGIHCACLDQLPLPHVQCTWCCRRHLKDRGKRKVRLCWKGKRIITAPSPAFVLSGDLLKAVVALQNPSNYKRGFCFPACHTFGCRRCCYANHVEAVHTFYVCILSRYLSAVIKQNKDWLSGYHGAREEDCYST